MEQGTMRILFDLLRSAFRGTALSQGIPQLTPEVFWDLLLLSRKHNIEHLLVYGLQCNTLISEENIQLSNIVFEAAYRCEQLCFELEQLCDALEFAGIPFMPLKGAVLRKYYPEPWMRTSCDIDVLVHKDDVEKSVSVLLDKCGCTCYKKGSHDVALITPSAIRIELHYTLIEDRISESSSAVLERVWDFATVCKGSCCRYEMNDELFYFYHIAHMAKHFENGGCGIRPFADIWFLKNTKGLNSEICNALLVQGKLLDFARAAEKLSDVWFDDAEPDEVSLQMEKYVLDGGVYGSTENRISVQQHKKHGKAGYLISKIFMPYDEIKYIYPILKKHRWLTPFIEVLRWLNLMFGKRSGSVLKEIKINQSMSSDESDDMKKFLTQLGLMEK